MTAQDVSDRVVDGAADLLREALGDRVALPGDADFDRLRMPWNVAIDQRPFAVAYPQSAEDVVDIVRAAVKCGLRVAPQSTGHGAAALADTDIANAVLVNLSAMRGVSVDPDVRTARVLGGTQWNDVIDAIAPYGLAAMHGSSGDVSVAGYILAGGLSFYGRTHGLAITTVRAVQLVTADGSLVRASAEEHPDMFWAVRGGGGAFGVVVSLEIDLLPYGDVFAGMLLWDAVHAPAVSRAWAAWTQDAPESATTSLRVMNFPPMPDLPPFLSGRSVVVIDGAILESDDVAAELLVPLRALEPEMDTFARMPSAALVAVHMDPPDPTPVATIGGMVAELPAEAVDAFVAAGSAPGVFIAELRHCGGAIARGAAGGGAISALGGEYCVVGIGVVPALEMAAPVARAVRGVVDALRPWHADSLALTFVDGGVDRAPAWGRSRGRLIDLKYRFDSDDVFASGHPVETLG
ncbi:FAD-binding oxidoreductase [Microbacterium koreense]|uniref:FAD-binding oxidoreductase n=1 Tax=Microbacterium koreense TaxID=323761 RepID=A0ABW2ZMM0_9MICO